MGRQPAVRAPDRHPSRVTIGVRPRRGASRGLNLRGLPPAEPVSDDRDAARGGNLVRYLRAPSEHRAAGVVACRRDRDYPAVVSSIDHQRASYGVALLSMMRPVWMAFASTRLFLIVIGYAVLTAFPANPVESWQGIVFPDHNWIDGWVRWDSMWYEAIVNPHPRFLPSGHSTANFFPLYSWLSWLVSLPLRAMLDHERAFYAGGLIVSSAAFLLGLAAVMRLTSRLAGADVAVRTRSEEH